MVLGSQVGSWEFSWREVHWNHFGYWKCQAQRRSSSAESKSEIYWGIKWEEKYCKEWYQQKLMRCTHKSMMFMNNFGIRRKVNINNHFSSIPFRNYQASSLFFDNYPRSSHQNYHSEFFMHHRNMKIQHNSPLKNMNGVA